MTLKSASEFVGQIPKDYDAGLGPILFEPFAQDLARRAAALAPSNVLELAAGTGVVTRRLRDALPHATRIVATDLNPPMLVPAAAKFRIDENTTFRQADAMSLPFADASFDLIVCQFGVMFFPDKMQSFREARRVLKPGGHYLFNAWGQMTENPFSLAAVEIGQRTFPDNPPGFYNVPFSYPDPGKARADLEAAGFTGIVHERVSARSAIADWKPFAHGLVFGNPLIEEIRARGSASPEDVRDAVAQRLAEIVGPAPTELPLVANLFSAQSL